MNFSDAIKISVWLAVPVAIIKWPRISRILHSFGSYTWPVVPATVEAVIVQTYSGRSGTTYNAEITYSYAVDGEYYSGYYKGDLCSSEAEVDKWITQFPKGTKLQVRVHPTNPEKSVLDTIWENC